MDHRIHEAQCGKASTEYILPFFWQHGEDHAVLTEVIDAIQNSGVNAFCVESRTHEQFCEEKWWQDFGFLLEEAKQRGMRVWLLDDKRFPTGYANNYIETHPELRALRLRMAFRDFVGPRTGTAILPAPKGQDESFISIAAYRRTEKGNVMSGEGIQLWPKLENGLIWWDIPDGVWRVYYIVATHDIAVPSMKNYVDKMSEASCKAMLHAVYDPHYEHYKDYFGHTFAGFFSDEPGFANEIGHYTSNLGREEMFVPWNDEMVTVLSQKTGLDTEKILKLLPSLWHEVAGYTTLVRTSYMDAASETYSRNFGWLLGDWCRAHNVMYIGHIIEDNNAHQRLGYGPGHFFRSMDGQDMGGCDIVLHQIIPGHLAFDHSAMIHGGADPAFFHYTLAKLASSHAHIQPLKKGRAMCEIFGAFGWAEGIPHMKYLADLMLVSGINYFVPHAFTPKERDDDCPPHFYALGRNTQYPLFRKLMDYMQRVSHVLTGGVHQADVAVYYNAEAEWAGGKTMLQQEVCQELTRHQIDYDLIPQDTICGEIAVIDRRLAVNKETYGALVVPYSQYLPAKLLQAFAQLAEEGLLVLFVDDYPDAASEYHSVEEIKKHCETVVLQELATKLSQSSLQGIQMQNNFPAFRFFHTRRNDTHIFMLWNEDIFTEMDTDIIFPANGRAVFYDAWTNRMLAAQQNGCAVRVRLAPSEAIVLCFGAWEEAYPDFDYRDEPLHELTVKWKVSLRQAKEQAFTNYPLFDLGNLSHDLPDFCGVIRYETVWTIEKPEDFCVLQLSGVGETAQLWVNDCDCGAVVGKPYRFAIAGKLKKGENQLRVEVMNNMAYRERDPFSTYLPLPPTGLTGPVLIG